MAEVYIDDILGPKKKPSLPADRAIDDILGSRPEAAITTGFAGYETVEPFQFDIDPHIGPITATEQEDLAYSFHPLVRPFVITGYGVASGFNRGAAHFAEAMDLIDRWGQAKAKGYPTLEYILKSPTDWRRVADAYDADRAKWRKRAEEVGINFLEELIWEGVGEAPWGIGEFILNIPWAATMGYMEAEEKGENPIAGALVSAAERGVLGYMLRVIHPLKQYLRAPLMGATFAAQARMKGAPWPEAGKAFITGMGYSLTSPGGAMGLNEVARNLRKAGSEFYREPRPGELGFVTEEEVLPTDISAKGISREKERVVPEAERELLREFADRTGEDPEIRDRKFWKTVEEAERTHPEAKRIMKEIQAEEPQINISLPNRDSLNKAYDTLDKMGFEEAYKYVLTDKDLKPVEKGALFGVLMEKAQKDGDFQRFVEVMDNFSFYLVDIGRGEQIASVWNRSTPMGFIRWCEKQIENVNRKQGWLTSLFGGKRVSLTKADKEYLAKEFSRMQAMPEGVEKTNTYLELVDYVALKVPPGASEIFDAFRYQNMLCGIQTQERNIGWNMANTLIYRPYELSLRGGIDYVRSGLRGKERQAYITDVPEYYKSLWNAVPNASTAFKNAWRMKPGEMMGKPDLGVRYKTPFELARAKQLPKITTVTQRFMEGCDKFNAALISAAEYANLKKKGWSDAEAYQRAQSVAERFLLRDQLNPGDPGLSYPARVLEGMGSGIDYMRRLPVIGKPLGWFVPFLRTPIKVGTAMVERSPLGWMRSLERVPKSITDPALRKAAAEKAWEANLEPLSRLMGGAIVTAVGATWALNGEVAWAPPSNEVLKGYFYASGRKPFSFKVGEKWYPLWYLGPYALAFAFPAAVKYYHEETNKSLTASEEEQIAHIAEGIARFVGSQTSAQSIGNFFAWASGDVDYQVRNQLGFTFGQIIPFNAMARYINKALDPVYRRPAGFWEQVMKDLPLFSKSLPPRYTPFMEESKREWFNMLVPYDIGVERPAYEGMYNYIRMEQRYNYLNDKLQELVKKMEKREITGERSVEEFRKIFEGMPKAYRGLQP